MTNFFSKQTEKKRHSGVLIQVHIFTFSSHWSLSSRVSLSLIQQKIYSVKTSTYSHDIDKYRYLFAPKQFASESFKNYCKWWKSHVYMGVLLSSSHVIVTPQKSQRKTTLWGDPTSQNAQATYIVTFPSTYKSNWNNVTESSQHTPRASFFLSTYTCYVYERSFA